MAVWLIIILTLDNPALLLHLSNIQVADFHTAMFQHIRLNFLIGSLTLRSSQIQLVHLHFNFNMLLRIEFGKKAYRLHMARYLLIDVRFCARSRKHILSKRKQVHTSDIAHSQMQTAAICGKIDIHITVLTIEVYGNKSV